MARAGAPRISGKTMLIVPMSTHCMHKMRMMPSAPGLLIQCACACLQAILRDNSSDLAHTRSEIVSATSTNMSRYENAALTPVHISVLDTCYRDEMRRACAAAAGRSKGVGSWYACHIKSPHAHARCARSRCRGIGMHGHRDMDPGDRKARVDKAVAVVSFSVALDPAVLKLALENWCFWS